MCNFSFHLLFNNSVYLCTYFSVFLLPYNPISTLFCVKVLFFLLIFKSLEVGFFATQTFWSIFFTKLILIVLRVEYLLDLCFSGHQIVLILEHVCNFFKKKLCLI
ncbi:hypothetical protein L1987_69375 [Smallanthus sonchifolius]|uniref:Uncharacterized protein n=1 Tax=Smallanthus sonchifolius TaxID=185202 RepID=A0ACB9B5J4_9ASTR|nr:hypothetical protein L1987_69375 [Smallanthus sonchifolius]